MTGIFSRLVADNDNLPAHLCESIVVFAATGDFTDAQILASVNSTIVAPLAGDEITDLQAVVDELRTGTVQDRLVYLEKFKAAVYAWTHGAASEAALRNVLGI